MRRKLIKICDQCNEKCEFGLAEYCCDSFEEECCGVLENLTKTSWINYDNNLENGVLCKVCSNFIKDEIATHNTFICIHINDYDSVLIVKVQASSTIQANIIFVEYLKDKEGIIVDENSIIRIRPLDTMEEI